MVFVFKTRYLLTFASLALFAAIVGLFSIVSWAKTNPHYEVTRVSTTDGRITFIIHAQIFSEVSQAVYCSVVRKGAEKPLAFSYIGGCVWGDFPGASSPEDFHFDVLESHDQKIIALFAENDPSIILCLVDHRNDYVWPGVDTTYDDPELLDALAVLKADYGREYQVGELDGTLR